MKKLMIATVFLQIFTGYPILAQVNQIIRHVDTLQSGDVIVTISDSQGNIINKGLAKPGFSFQNDTVDLVFPTSTTSDNPEGIFIDNINLPGVDGGFLPQDIVYNQHNYKYYIYGYRKVMISDTNMQVIKTIDISEVDGFSTFYSDYHERRIFVHPTQNMVYGMTINGALFSIDQYYNKEELTDSIGDYLIERSSMIYRESDNTIWYYFYVKDENMINKTLLYKYALTNSQLSPPLPIQGIIGYDIESINYEANYLILLSTNEGIRRYNPDMTSLSTIEPLSNFGHIAVMNILIFAHLNSNSSMLICNPDGGGQQVLSLDYPNVRFIYQCGQVNKLYLSGYSESSSGIDIIFFNGTQWEKQNCIYRNIFGLTENSTQIIGCGKDKIVFFNKQIGNQTYFTSTSLGQMYRVAPGSGTNIGVATQPLNGSVLKISSSGTQILETGGNISAICRKGDKMYAAVNKFNNKGYILVLNASSSAVIDRVTPSFVFNPVDVFCLDDENVENDRIYVIYVIPDGDFTKNKVMYFEIGDPSQMTNSDIEFQDGFLEYLITPNETICLGLKTPENVCPGECRIYFYDYELKEKNPYYYSATAGCIKEFDYVSALDYIVFVSACNNTIYFFKDSQYGIDPYASCSQNSFHPYSFCYNNDNGLGYCFTYGENSTNLYSIDMNIFVISEIEDNDPFQKVNEIFYNPNDTYVYGISAETIYRIGDDAVIGEYNLEKIFDIENRLNREDDYIFDTDNNFLYLVITDEDSYINTKKVLKVDLSNGTNEPIDLFLTYQNYIQVNYPNKVYQRFGKTLAYYPEKQNLYCAQMYFSNSTLITTHSENKPLTGNWDWISFPCMPRLGNDGYDSQTLLENINPLLPFLRLITSEIGEQLELTYTEPYWYTDEIQFLYSTKGYKYYSEPITTQNLPVTGLVLDPSTPIPLSSQYENWIGYFLEYPLRPEKAFAGAWDKLTRITTKEWTMFKINGQWFGSTRITPINYGDGLIVTTAVNCELIWGYNNTQDEDYEYPPTEFFTFNEKAEYTPFYFEMDSTSGIQEIGLTVNDSCVGAAVVKPGDSIVEVNAYFTGTQSGMPIEVQTWNGYKSLELSPKSYSVVDPVTRKRISRKVYTDEHRPYYLISFKAGETAEDKPVVMLQGPSPNPFSHATMMSFVLNNSARVSVTVHNLQGNHVKTLMSGYYPEGYYEAGWTGDDASGKKTGNGIYILRLTVDNIIITNEKVVFIE